jgi:hypothetical protein
VGIVGHIFCHTVEGVSPSVFLVSEGCALGLTGTTHLSIAVNDFLQILPVLDIRTVLLEVLECPTFHLLCVLPHFGNMCSGRSMHHVCQKSSLSFGALGTWRQSLGTIRLWFRSPHTSTWSPISIHYVTFFLRSLRNACLGTLSLFCSCKYVLC